MIHTLRRHLIKDLKTQRSRIVEYKDSDQHFFDSRILILSLRTLNRVL